jgi:hypothetical protein
MTLAESGLIPVGVVAEALVDGEPLPPPRDCTCSSVLDVETKIAFILSEDESKVVRREVLLKVICGECGKPFEVEQLGRNPRDGSIGIVHDLRPVE